jgi:hypothetical protein
MLGPTVPNQEATPRANCKIEERRAKGPSKAHYSPLSHLLQLEAPRAIT